MPPSTYVGCVILGPYLVHYQEIWSNLYSMDSKAVHIEMIDDMSTDALLNALRSLIAIRGPVRQIHTDRPRGTNFIGTANELHQQVKLGKLSKYTTDNISSLIPMYLMPATWELSGSARLDPSVMLWVKC